MQKYVQLFAFNRLRFGGRHEASYLNERIDCEDDDQCYNLM